MVATQRQVSAAWLAPWLARYELPVRGSGQRTNERTKARTSQTQLSKVAPGAALVELLTGHGLTITGMGLVNMLAAGVSW